MEWHQLDAQETFDRLGADRDNGLDPASVETLREQHGTNELIGDQGRSSALILWSQLKEPLVILLVVAAVISGSIGEVADAVAILVIVVLNTILGFTQEFRAEQAMKKLKEMAAPEVRVRRGGEITTVPSAELVPGDLILIEAGNRIAADCRVVENFSLEVQEAALTGESQTVSKNPAALADPDLPVGDRTNMIYMGTDVTSGRGEAVVAETGMNTELGKIAGMISSAGEKQTPLQRRLARLGMRLAVLALAIVAVVFLLGVLRKEDLTVMLMTALSMAVAAVPEGLPAVATISLALGARRMLKRNALIRKLPAVETLGSVTVICSDKTGTLTANRMEVTSLWDAEEDEPSDLGELPGETEEISGKNDPRTKILHDKPLLGGVLFTGELCNDASLKTQPGSHAPATKADHFLTVGEPTESALLAVATRFGFDKTAIEEQLHRVAEAPFDSERKRMTTIHEVPPENSLDESTAAVLRQLGGYETNWLALMKGAAESVVTVCDRILFHGKEISLTDEHLERIHKIEDRLASQGKRVLGFAYRWIDDLPAIDGGAVDAGKLESGFVFLGLAGMIDPPRSEAKAAVSRCKSAGIRPVMITGDHPETARFIAAELGIATETTPVTGRELEKTGDKDLITLSRETSVYARVSPEHKLRIVEALQKDGQIVAMTGDGVNDAPALKKADIGVAMGITGTDVSKDAAEAVLLDDDFATIVASVEEGRTIYDNIRKFLKYTLTSNTGEIWVMLAAPFLGMPLPLVPLQILWINLLTDGLPGLALAVEPGESDVMNRSPRPPKEPVLGREMTIHILVFGLLMGAVSLGSGFAFWRNNPTTVYDSSWGTIVFTVLTLAQMGHALAIRSSRDSLFRIGLLSNKPILAAIGTTFLLQLAVIYIPFLQNIFRTTALSLKELLFCLGLSSVVFIAVELEKWFWRRREDG